MRRQHTHLAVTLRSPGVRGASERDGRERVHVALGNARRRVWGPLALRAVAVALALVGLAGMGSVAGRASRPGSELELAPKVGAGAQLAVLGAAEPVIEFPGVPRRPPNERSPSRAAGAPAGATGAAGTAPAPPLGAVPCPCGAGEPLEGPPPRSSDTARASPAVVRARPPTLERAATPELPPSPASGGAAPAITADGRVVLNRATASELMRLPGVGAKRAAAIVEQRQRLGRFRQPSELMRIKGIGPRTLERLLPQLVLD